MAQIGVVFGQRTQLWWDLPVIESFDLLKDIYRIPEQNYRRTRDQTVDLLSLEAFLDVPVRQLSLGQRSCSSTNPPSGSMPPRNSRFATLPSDSTAKTG